jgi:hypothetical protein
MSRAQNAVLSWVLPALAGVLLVGDATAARAQDCRAQQSQRERQCRDLAEKRAEICPEGQAAAEGAKAAECRKLSEQIGDLCTRNPCAPPKAKGKGKRKPTKSKRPASKKSG